MNGGGLLSVLMNVVAVIVFVFWPWVPKDQSQLQVNGLFNNYSVWYLPTYFPKRLGQDSMTSKANKSRQAKDNKSMSSQPYIFQILGLD